MLQLFPLAPAYVHKANAYKVAFVNLLNYAAQAEWLPGRTKLSLDRCIDTQQKSLVGVNPAAGQAQVEDAPTLTESGMDEKDRGFGMNFMPWMRTAFAPLASSGRPAASYRRLRLFLRFVLVRRCRRIGLRDGLTRFLLFSHCSGPFRRSLFVLRLFFRGKFLSLLACGPGDKVFLDLAQYLGQFPDATRRDSHKLNANRIDPVGPSNRATEPEHDSVDPEDQLDTNPEAGGITLPRPHPATFQAQIDDPAPQRKTMVHQKQFRIFIHGKSGTFAKMFRCFRCLKFRLCARFHCPLQPIRE